jgi:CAAX prenyl protease-like protein
MPSRTHPVVARAAPFAVYIAFLVVESFARDALDTRWLYAAQIATVAALLAWFWPAYAELGRPAGTPVRDWLLALGVGAAVFVLWINLDFGWARIGAGRGVAGELVRADARDTGLLLRFFAVVLVVPVMEELFWRSFLVRWLERSEFLAVDPRTVGWRPILVASVVFGAEHHLWLAGIAAGIAYGWLYRRTGSLWTVILAHALTNLLLEAWVHRTGSWHFL